jgi:signal transduction histidine kinase
MQFIRKNPLIIAFFVLILGPTLLLSFFSFRNILNANYLAEKTFEENRLDFKIALETAVKDEHNSFLQETKAAALFLYEQPHTLTDLNKNSPYKKVDGVSSIYLFNADTLVYPHFSKLFKHSQKTFSPITPSILEQEIFVTEKQFPEQAMLARSFRLIHSNLETKQEQTMNLLGMIRIAYKKQNYEEALKLLNILEKRHKQEGYLTPDLTISLALLHFEIFIKQKQHRKAEEFVLNKLEQFLSGKDYGDLYSVQFFFETVLDQILSFEDLSQDSREKFWNLRENLNREFSHSESYIEKQNDIIQLFKNNEVENDGIKYSLQGNDILFRMSYPWLPGAQIIVGLLDKKIMQKRFSETIISIAKDWKDIPYAILDNKDSLIISNSKESENIAFEYEIGNGLNWRLLLYEKDMKELQAESRQRIILIASLIILSLITVIVGIFFMLRFIQQERKLLSMKANFLSSVSHELKTPLTAIKMYAESIAQGRITRKEKVPEYAKYIEKGATRLENQIGAILDYTRMENGRSAFQWVRLNLATAAERVYESLKPLAEEKGLTIEKSIEPDNFISGDNTAINSMFQSLVENAIKYTNAPGNIFIRVYSEKEKAIFEVEDSGIGIPLKEQKNIFNDFYRVGDEMTRNTKGSGLGLAIVKRAADAHHAIIKLTSKPQKGSTFTVQFKKVE